jgi:hypothetical protein
MKRRDKSSSLNSSNCPKQQLPTVVRGGTRNSSGSPTKRDNISHFVSLRARRRGYRSTGSILLEWVTVLASLVTLGAVYWCVRWSQQAFDDDDALLKASEYSRIVTHVGSSGTGLMNKYFYRFHNVRIKRNRLKFFYDPDGTFAPPTEDHWVDIVSGNATSPKHPTVLVIKGDAQPIRWHYMPIDYIPVKRRIDACHAAAHAGNSRAFIIKKTAYLLQVRYSYNIWHTWNEGIMGIFPDPS